MVQASRKTWAACCILASCWLILGASVLWQAWIYETDNPTVTLAWDVVEGAAYYELKTIAKYPVQEWSRTVVTTTAVINRPRTGLFRFAVRACPASGTGNCSDWAYSDGPTAQLTKVDGQVVNQPWGIFWRLSPVIIK